MVVINRRTGGQLVWVVRHRGVHQWEVGLRGRARQGGINPRDGRRPGVHLGAPA